MSSNIVLPDLSTWAQRHITAVYSAKTADEFNSAFDAFVSEHVKITVNGKSMSREEYKQMVQGEITADVGAEVSFNGVVAVPSEDKDLRAIGVSCPRLVQNTSRLTSSMVSVLLIRLAPSVRSSRR